MRLIEREAQKYKSQIQDIVKNTWGFSDQEDSNGASAASNKVADVLNWLANFTVEELPYMAKLLSRIEYINDSSVASNLIKALERLQHTLGGFSNVTFFSIGDSSGESGGRYMHDIRKYFQLEETSTPNICPMEFLQKNPDRILVFIDDFIGGGTQAPRYIEEKNITETDIYYVAPYATTCGIKKIQEKKLFTQVYFTVAYNDDELAFKGQNIFDTEDDLKNIKKIAEQYGEKLYSMYPLGHSNVQSLIVFEKNVPNNSLPIIWAGLENESAQEVAWNSLFERRKKYSDTITKPKINSSTPKYEDYFLPCNSVDISEDYCQPLDFYPDELQKNENLTEINNIFSTCFSIQDVKFDYSKKPCYDSYGALNNSYIMQEFYKDFEYPKAQKITLKNNKNAPNMKVLVNDFFQSFNTDIRQYKVIFISGDIGAGKSTLIGKLMFDLKEEYNCEYVAVEGTEHPRISSFESGDKKNILFLDNLDSFSFSKERFMFMDTYRKDNEKYGFSVFNDGIKSVRSIVETTKKLMEKKNIDILVVAVRPYVLTHFFDTETLNGFDLSLLNRTMIYNIFRDKQITQKVVYDRIILFQHITGKYIDYLKNKGDNATKHKETQELLKEILKDFDSIMYKFVPSQYGEDLELITAAESSFKEHTALERLYNITAQGYRTIVNIFAELKYNPDLFSKYFSSDILLIFKMGLFKKYCQILPSTNGCNARINQGESGKTYNYPNMFLSVSNSEANGSISCGSTYLSYWLKILILEYINDKTTSMNCEFIALKDVVSYFSLSGNYDIELVKIALGSLGTINEYNCIEYKFTLRKIRNAEELIDTSGVKLTRRGKYFVSKKTFFLFNDLELFIDDWQLPLPSISPRVKNHIAISDDLRNELEIEIRKNKNYDYLLDEYGKMSSFVMSKAKMSIWFIFLVESCRKYEFNFYGIKESYGYDEIFFKDKLKRLIDDVNSIILGEISEEGTPAYTDQGENVIEVLNNFATLCDKNKKSIDIFFEKVFKDKVLVECNPVCID
ncbi:MAG TPA: hypothetical protein EYG92_11095 [Lutibacter sp.]|nr:hypothetical protein [Lutibacter sp.]